MRYIIFLALINISLSSKGQIATFGFNDFRGITDNIMLFQNNQRFNVNDIDGTVFLKENFEIGSIVDLNNDISTELYLRYNAYQDLFEIILEEGATQIKTIDRSTNFVYKYGGETFKLVESNNLNIYHYNTGNSFLVEVKKYNDEITLYKRYVKELVEGKKATSSYEQDKPSKLKDETLYYLKDKNKLVLLEVHKKRILEKFSGDDQEKLEDFIKDEKIKFRGNNDEIEDELVKLFEYYSSM